MFQVDNGLHMSAARHINKKCNAAKRRFAHLRISIRRYSCRLITISLYLQESAICSVYFSPSYGYFFTLYGKMRCLLIFAV